MDIGSAHFEPGTRKVLFQSYHGIQRWDTNSGELAPVQTGIRGRFPLRRPKRNLILTRRNQKILLWDRESGQPQGSFSQGDKLQEAGFLGGGRAVYGWTRRTNREGRDDILQVWKVSGGKLLWSQRGNLRFRQLALAQGKWIAAINPARVLAAASGKRRSFLRRAIPALPAEFHSKGKTLLTREAPESSRANLWETASARRKEATTWGGRNISLPPEIQLELLKDGKETVLKITENGAKAVKVPLRLQAPPEALTFSPDRQWLAYILVGKLHLWRWQAGGKPFFVPLPGPAQWVTFEADRGRLLVSTNRTIYILQSNQDRVRGLIGLLRSLTWVSGL
jgi:hypothetical protein